MLVAARAPFGVDIVAQRRSAVLQTVAEDDLDALGEPLTSLRSNPFASRVDSGEEKSLIGVDVADASDGSLAQQLRLDCPGASANGRVQACSGEVGAERFWPHGVQCWNVCVIARIDHPKPTKSACVVKYQASTVPQRPDSARVGAAL